MGFFDAVASFFGTHQQNKNIDKQLSAQAQENSRSRQYNLALAKLQNAWNVEQWNRENAYNSPAAQMERMRQAGLNPDMMYGGGVSGNLAASSPTLTSGAPSSPMDFTALGSKATVFDSLMKSAQLDNLRAQTDKIESETKGQDISNEFAPAEKALGIELTETEIDNNRKFYEKMSKEIEDIESQIMNRDADTMSKVQEIVFNQKVFDDRVRKFAAEAKISEADAKVAMQTVMGRVGIVSQQYNEAKAKASAAEVEALFKKWQYDKRIWDEFLGVCDLGLDIANTVLGFKNFSQLLKGEVIVTQGPKGTIVTEKSKQ